MDFDYSDVLNCDLDKCKILFETIGEVIGRSTRTTLSLKSNFYELGGNSLNSIFTVSKLRSKGYFIDISEFITAKNLEEMLTLLTEDKIDQVLRDPTEKQTHLEAQPLATDHKQDTIE